MYLCTRCQAEDATAIINAAISTRSGDRGEHDLSWQTAVYVARRVVNGLSLPPNQHLAERVLTLLGRRAPLDGEGSELFMQWYVSMCGCDSGCAEFVCVECV
jgi:hypothetical protein